MKSKDLANVCERNVIYHLVKPGCRVTKDDLVGVDWVWIQEVLKRQEIPHLILQLLTDKRISCYVPSELKKELLFQNLKVPAKRWRLVSGVGDVQKVFVKHGLTAVLLKGMALYEKNLFTLRPLNDIDLLVREENLNLFDEILCVNGFRVHGVRTKWHKRVSQEKRRLNYVRDGLNIDLHWGLVYYLDGVKIEIDTLDFWKKATVSNNFRGNILLPPEKNILLHLFTHHMCLGNVGFLSLKQLHDLFFISSKLGGRDPIIDYFKRHGIFSKNADLNYFVSRINEIMDFIEELQSTRNYSDLTEESKGIFDSVVDGRGNKSISNRLRGGVGLTKKIRFLYDYFIPERDHWGFMPSYEMYGRNLLVSLKGLADLFLKK